jgi:hypothetical protein
VLIQFLAESGALGSQFRTFLLSLVACLLQVVALKPEEIEVKAIWRALIDDRIIPKCRELRERTKSWVFFSSPRIFSSGERPSNVD